MQTRRRYRHRSQGRSRHLNTPDAIRHRRALADAKREELAATEDLYPHELEALPLLAPAVAPRLISRISL